MMNITTKKINQAVLCLGHQSALIQHQAGIQDQNRGLHPKGPPSPDFLFFSPFLLLFTSENFYHNIFLSLSLALSFSSSLSPSFPSFLCHSKLQVIPLPQSTILAAATYWTPAMCSITVHGPNPNGTHCQHWLNFTIVRSLVLTSLRFSNLPSLFSYCHLCHLFLSFFYLLKVIYKSVNQYLCAMFFNIENSENVIK